MLISLCRSWLATVAGVVLQCRELRQKQQPAVKMCRRKRPQDIPVDKRSKSGESLRSYASSIVVVELLQIPIVILFSIVIPSLFKFVTGSPDINRHVDGTSENSAQQWPGLGETETFYSWVATACSLGALVIAPVAGQMPRLIGYRLSVIFACLSLAGGGLLYSFSLNGWMVFAARFLMGVFDGCAYVFTYSYLSDVGNELERLKRMKKEASVEESQTTSATSERTKNTIKDKLFSINLMIKSLTYPASFVVTTIMVQFRQVNQYRWPGYFIAVLSVVYCGAFLLLFRPQHKSVTTAITEREGLTETERRDREQMHSRSCKVCSGLACRRRSLPTFKEIFIYAVLIGAGYVQGAVFILIDTLLTPILSDNFGFTVADTSYFFLGAMVLPLIATIMLFLLKAFKVSNRAILLFCTLAILTGNLLSSDWQSFGHDPCKHRFTRSHPSDNLSLPLHDMAYLNETATKHESVAWDEYLIHGPLSVNESLLLADHCSSLSTAEHTCYWNPLSRVTGKLCIECHRACRSEQKSVNFIQFCVGFSIILFVSQLFVTTVYSVASDYTPKAFQGTIISLITTGAGLARIVTPLWGEWIYQLFAKRTLPPLAVFSVTVLVLLFGLIVSYKDLTYKPFKSGKKTDIRLEVTNPTYLETDG